MSKLLANQISNYNDNGPVEVKDGVNIPTGKPLQVAGGAGTSGQYLTSTGSSIAWSTLPTIPAAQVQTDWNASGTIAEILNKPTLATVATSGSYTDLLNTPTIPSAQVQSDWNASGTLAEILNKPTLFSGSYDDLTNKPTIPSAPTQADWSQTDNTQLDYIENKPTIPSNLSDLANVSTTAPNNNEVLKWNGTNWAPATDATGGGGGGSTTFVGLTDTPANFTSQAGKYLKVNAGATALEYVTLPVDPDTNTTYSQSSVADGSNVKLRLTDSGSTNDDILLTAGTNISFSSVTAAGFTINHSGSAPASVVTDDNAPSSPSDGDLWWKSDEGRLKVYYADGSSDQWVDASPVLSPTSMTSGSNSIAVTSTRSTVTGPLRVTGTLTGQTTGNKITYASHFIPDTNAAYDLGNAEYKVRHLFLSDNTLYYEGDFLKVAQHNSGGSAQSASYLIPLAKLKDALNASSDYEAFKTAILAITDA